MRILLMTHRYLCVNSALHYLRPPMRGLKPVVRQLSNERLGTHAFRIISPLRGLKLVSTTEIDTGIV